jgi:hypothetical protein
LWIQKVVSMTEIERQFHHFSQASSVFRSAEYSSLDTGSIAVPLK